MGTLNGRIAQSLCFWLSNLPSIILNIVFCVLIEPLVLTEANLAVHQSLPNEPLNDLVVPKKK